MNLTYELHDDIAIIHFDENELTATCEDRFRNTINILVLQRVKHFILDFSKVEFMNSFFLAILMETYKSFKDRDGMIVVAELGQSLKTIFHVMRISEIFPVYGTVSEALQAIEQSPSPSPDTGEQSTTS